MNTVERPTKADGRICYIEIPSNDLNASADFYQKVFAWNIRRHGDGSISFDDTAGEVSGTWVKDKNPNDGTSLMIHIMVNDIRSSLEKIVANGGNIRQPPSYDVPGPPALFSDPTGNVFGIYQEPGSPKIKTGM